MTVCVHGSILILILLTGIKVVVKEVKEGIKKNGLQSIKERGYKSDTSIPTFFPISWTGNGCECRIPETTHEWIHVWKKDANIRISVFI